MADILDYIFTCNVCNKTMANNEEYYPKAVMSSCESCGFDVCYDCLKKFKGFKSIKSPNSFYVNFNDVNHKHYRKCPKCNEQPDKVLGCHKPMLRKKSDQREKNMQAELKFDLNNEDDAIDFLLAQRGARFHSMIYDIEMLLRSKSKHGDYQHEETHVVVDAIYGEVLDIISGYNEDIP